MPSECTWQQAMSAISIGFSIMAELIVLNNIAFVSVCSTAHIAYIIDQYHFFFQWPASNFCIALTLVPLLVSVAMTISVNMNRVNFGLSYGPSLFVYIAGGLTALLVCIQYYVFRTVKIDAMLDRAKLHFPELDFDVMPWEHPKVKSSERVGLLSSTQDDVDNSAPSAAAVEVPDIENNQVRSTVVPISL